MKRFVEAEISELNINETAFNTIQCWRPPYFPPYPGKPGNNGGNDDGSSENANSGQ